MYIPPLLINFQRRVYTINMHGGGRYRYAYDIEISTFKASGPKIEGRNYRGTTVMISIRRRSKNFISNDIVYSRA